MLEELLKEVSEIPAEFAVQIKKSAKIIKQAGSNSIRERRRLQCASGSSAFVRCTVPSGCSGGL
jgi:hypothetical protein